MTTTPRLLMSFIICGLPLFAPSASAQSLGQYRLQLQPYCNLLTINITAHGSMFALDGFDDQCGAGQRAAAVGTAFPNPDGTIGIGLSVVLAPGGTPVHIDARISLATLSGPWRDSVGNAGTLVFTSGAASAGPLRPVPPNGVAPGSITTASVAAGAIGAAQIDANQVQARVTGACPVGQYLRGILVNGDVVCEALPAATNVFSTLQHDQVRLPAGNVPKTITALRGVPAGAYLLSGYATAVHPDPYNAAVRCGIRAAGQDSFGTWGSATSVGTEGPAAWFAQVTMTLPVTSSTPFDAELYCLTNAQQPAVYLEQVHLYGFRVDAVQLRPPAQD